MDVIMSGEKLGKKFWKLNLLSSNKYDGDNVMVWECVAASGVGNLHFIEVIMEKHI